MIFDAKISRQRPTCGSLFTWASARCVQSKRKQASISIACGTISV
jgi:hypothetical protein